MEFEHANDDFTVQYISHYASDYEIISGVFGREERGEYIISLTFLPGPIWPRVAIHVRVLCMGEIGLLKKFSMKE